MDLEELRALAPRGEAPDRAFVDANLRMAWSRAGEPDERAALEAALETLRSESCRAHAALRAEIASGAARGSALRARFDDVPMLERDHFVEEVLGVAYPPFELEALGPELIAYTPSGYDEIVHAFDATELGPGDRFLDVGSGTGKVVLLAALLCGAKSAGVECDSSLVALASAAAADLALSPDGARFEHRDARDLASVEADVVFMYLPFTGRTLEAVLARITEARPRRLCAGAIDLARHDELVPAGPPRSWLQVYAFR